MQDIRVLVILSGRRIHALCRLCSACADYPCVGNFCWRALNQKAHSGPFHSSLFCELAAKGIFLVSVWFEGIWVGLFCIMELGAFFFLYCSCAHGAEVDITLCCFL